MLTEYNIEQLFKTTFGSNPYKVPGLSEPPNETGYKLKGSNSPMTQITGSTLSTYHEGAEIWLPTWFRGLPANMFENGNLFLPYSVISLSGKKNIIETNLTERFGTVKELYNIDDCKILIKGFLIDKDKRIWPEKHLMDLQSIFELDTAFILDNALTNAVLHKTDLVCIDSVDIPEVEGGRKHVRPFAIELTTSQIFVLELEE